ncbi:class I SAM-dependent methyltransferase [Alphaproteobacteria bacterium]|nr:class I SAM-dependent methyltransferase [Alphaproteobacteria bacterium]MDB2406727.1 class I SAM-dependent methyltransferase [Alphaproteobacteria bacterium]MDB2540625.1 class I SAM-dependent methyltransferase [Alphaproteobacteria bacterium]MDB2649016.1 class I SAM-dependent methyltransferase [Alphaproteobacteria bacterium]
MFKILQTLQEVNDVAKRIDLKGNVFLTHSVFSAYIWQLTYLLCQIDVEKSERENISILEWGCGVGFHGAILRGLGFCVKSCDIPNALSVGQNYVVDENTITFLEHPILLPFEDEQFDVVLSFGVLEHVMDENASIVEIARVLRDDGLFFVTMLPALVSYINKFAHLRGNYYHDRLYTKISVQKLFSSAGLSVEKLRRAQILPRSKFSRNLIWEIIDRVLCVPFGWIATNYEIVAKK